MVIRDKLLKALTPQPDESFIGYILRLTEANYYDTPLWIMQMAGVAKGVDDTAFMFNNSLDLAPLERLTGVDRNKLEELIYHPAGPTRKKMGNYLLFGIAIMQYLIRPDRPKICPYCIRETGYTRRVWEIIPITTCPVHKCLLLDECPNCRARISWNRRSISRCHCELDWRECQSLQVEEHELVVTEHIYRLCNLTLANSKTAQPQINGNPLYQLDLWHFLSALTFVAGQYGGFIDTKGKYIVSLKRNVEIHRLLCKAFPTFNDWPKNFFSFLDWRREQTLDERYSYGLRREFKGYKFILYAQRLSKPLEFIRKGFEDYLTSQWNGGYLGHMRRLSASARRQAKYLPMQEAKQLLGTTYIYELIESGRLKAIVSQQGNRNLVLIERAILDELRWELERALSLLQLCKLLALSRKRVLELIDAGFFNPLRGPAIDGLKIWKFSVTEAKGLLAVLKSKVLQHVNVQSKKTINFRAVLVKLSWYGLTLSKFLRAVLNGEISPIGIGKGRGLLKFLFLNEQITEFLRCKSQLQGEQGYSVATVAKLLRTSKRNVWFLIRNKFIHAQRLSTCLYAGLTVKKSELERFTATFLPIKDVAAQLGTLPRYICGLLVAHGIQPILNGEEHKDSFIIFKKADLKGIDIASLVAMAKSEGRIVLPSPLKRRGPMKLNETQAATALGVSVDTVEQLVERGVLKQGRYRRPSEESADKYYFSVSLIEKWKKQPVNCLGIVSFLKAAEMVGSQPDKFYKKYIGTGRLKPIITGRLRSELYFSICDVEALVKLKELTITASEVAAICKVNLTCIHKLVVAGELNPISGPKVDGFGRNLYLRTDVERLHAQREAFKAEREKQGGTSRFGRLAGPQHSPVLERIRPRVGQLIRQWSAMPQGQRISGQRLYSQLIEEGYQVGINTVYVCLRELRQQADFH